MISYAQWNTMPFYRWRSSIRLKRTTARRRFGALQICAAEVVLRGVVLVADFWNSSLRAVSLDDGRVETVRGCHVEGAVGVAVSPSGRVCVLPAPGTPS